MRTKNKKWIVPILSIVPMLALAAFLAVGTLSNNGVQNVEAQGYTEPSAPLDSKKCEIDVGAAATNDVFGGGCSATGNSIDVVLFTTDTAAVDRRVYVTGGSQFPDVYGSNENDNASNDVEVLTDDRLGKKGVDRHTVRFTADAFGEKRSETITVSLSMADPTGRVYVFVYTPDADNDNGNLASDSTSLQGDATRAVLVQFQGAPAVGEDGPDRNSIVEDFQQCDLGADRAAGSNTNDADGDEADCNPDTSGGDNADSEDADDRDEIRSRLAVNVTSGSDSDAKVLVNGKEVELELAGPDANPLTSASIFVVVEDSFGNELVGADVRFNATIEPSTLDLDFQADRTEEAKNVGTGDDDIDNPTEVSNTVIPDGAAMAMREIDELPGDESYRITVEISAEGVPLGTVVIFREGTAKTLKAGVFNAECLVDPEDDAGKVTDTAGYADDNVVLEDNDDCDDSGMLRRFGREDVFVVKAHLEDSLGNAVGTASQISIKLTDEFDEPLQTGNPTQLMIAVKDRTEPTAWVYMVNKDAMLGNHMIEVSTTAKDADDEAIASVSLTVSVAGPPASYMLVNPDDTIALGGYGMFTVQAYDAVGGNPAFGDTTATDNMVEVFIQGLPDGNTRNLDGDMLMLDEDTGMGTFTIFAPNSAENGDTIRIFVASGGMETQHEVTFGAADTTGDMLGTPMDVVIGFNNLGALQVSWTQAANANGYFVYAINTDLRKINTDYKIAAADGDEDTVRLIGLTRGDTYDVYVAATGSGGANTLSAPARVTVQ